MLNRKNIRKWVDALRSGEYAQTFGRLRGSRGYCCLGVACQVYANETGVGAWEPLVNENAFRFILSDDNSRTASLPLAVLEWLGIEGSNPILEGYGAAFWNDIKGASFNEIADLIEKEYLS